MDLWTFLYSDIMEELNKEILDELASYLNTGVYYEDDSNLWPLGFMEETVFDKSNTEVCLNYSFVHFKNVNRCPFSCLSIFAKEKIELHSNQSSSSLFFINTIVENIEFWRGEALIILRDNQHSLEIISSYAYPNLYFKDKIWSEINYFSGGYSAVYKTLQKYLSILNDHGAWVFTTPPPLTHPTDTAIPQLGLLPSKELIENRFLGLSLEMAPEYSNVKEDLKCRTAREITIAEKKLYCEWHGKFELHQNRIHIHPPIPETEGKLIIAFFHKHLPLP
jgi:hypothetical protein